MPTKWLILKNRFFFSRPWGKLEFGVNGHLKLNCNVKINLTFVVSPILKLWSETIGILDYKMRGGDDI